MNQTTFGKRKQERGQESTQKWLGQRTTAHYGACSGYRRNIRDTEKQCGRPLGKPRGLHEAKPNEASRRISPGLSLIPFPGVARHTKCSNAAGIVQKPHTASDLRVIEDRSETGPKCIECTGVL
jgi:hypothetical protein